MKSILKRLFCIFAALFLFVSVSSFTNANPVTVNCKDDVGFLRKYCCGGPIKKQLERGVQCELHIWTAPDSVYTAPVTIYLSDGYPHCDGILLECDDSKIPDIVSGLNHYLWGELVVDFGNNLKFRVPVTLDFSFLKTSS